jgi:hypothetical protein
MEGNSKHLPKVAENFPKLFFFQIPMFSARHSNAVRHAATRKSISGKRRDFHICGMRILEISIWEKIVA